MRKSVLSLVVLASALTLGSAAFADETETAVNRESIRAAAGVTGYGHPALGYVEGAHVGHGFAGVQNEERAPSANDAALFRLGDRGLGSN
ncbi:hypothetical protein V5F59_00895 [Xanthobacter autotrophicus DSM 431]|uniref:hypothetical protein n=1 Tax=Xanthobacter nonsaccharivorans TaxID=3119912 RepID=UPI00372B6703